MVKVTLKHPGFSFVARLSLGKGFIFKNGFLRFFSWG